MIESDKKNEICSIWDNYIKSGKIVLDTKGKEIEDIGKLRVEAITHVKKLISEFSENNLDIYEFKTNLDSFNKRNNLVPRCFKWVMVAKVPAKLVVYFTL
jgi:hypothetical protein